MTDKDNFDVHAVVGRDVFADLPNDDDALAQFASEGPDASASRVPVNEAGVVGEDVDCAQQEGHRLARSFNTPAILSFAAIFLGTSVVGLLLYGAYPRRAAETSHTQPLRTSQTTVTPGERAIRSEPDRPVVTPEAKVVDATSPNDASSQRRQPTNASVSEATGAGSTTLATPVITTNESLPGITPRFTGTNDSSLSGEWSMHTRVDASGLKRYEGLRLAYRLRLQHVRDDHIIGSGNKVAENERRIGSADQTPITVRGEIDGERVVLNFSERGTRRESTGQLVLYRESDDVLRGRFASDAANSVGIVEVSRVAVNPLR